ncbi:MAG: prepilin-type N-terminal cleavage/methylation domain-containing protein [Cyanobacteria bacterium P01_A01_bin.3]
MPGTRHQVHDIRGFTLIEVMAATMILAVGVAASVAAMNASLNTTRRSQDSGNLTAVAQAEMERQRSLLLPVDVAIESENGIARSVEVAGCEFAGTELSCSPGTDCTDTSPACQIDITVTSDSTAETLEITSIKAISQ